MLYRLRRHPWAIEAHLEWSLAMVFAIPKTTAASLLPPGMEPDLYGDQGFVAAAFVKTRNQRPVWMPHVMAENFYLAGWRVFARARMPDGRNLRGLYILRSDTDSTRLSIMGALLTRYRFRKVTVQASLDEAAARLKFESWSPQKKLEVSFSADLSLAATLPQGSPFPDLPTARRFSGPMPFTFSYEEETHSLVVVKGSRQQWQPRPVTVEVRKLDYFAQSPFINHGPLQLANAFFVSHIDYRWERGFTVPVAPV